MLLLCSHRAPSNPQQDLGTAWERQGGARGEAAARTEVIVTGRAWSRAGETKLGATSKGPAQTPLSFPLPQQGKALWLSPQRTGCSGADGKVVPPGHTISSPAARAELPAPPVTAEHTSPFTPEQGGSCKTQREAFRSCRNKLLAAGTCFTL